MGTNILMRSLRMLWGAEDDEQHEYFHPTALGKPPAGSKATKTDGGKTQNASTGDDDTTEDEVGEDEEDDEEEVEEEEEKKEDEEGKRTEEGTEGKVSTTTKKKRKKRTKKKRSEGSGEGPLQGDEEDGVDAVPASPRPDAKALKRKNESDQKGESEDGLTTTTEAVRREGMLEKLRRGTLAALFPNKQQQQQQQQQPLQDEPEEVDRAVEEGDGEATETVPEWAQQADGEEMVGFMYKEGGRWKTWKERWFILKDGVLYYKASPTSKDNLGKVNLMRATITLAERYTNAKFETRTCVLISGARGRREYYMFCEDSPANTILWSEAMTHSVARMRRKERRGIQTSAEEESEKKPSADNVEASDESGKVNEHDQA